jgi:predicted anti-sigma-YlaC factor YlaD
MPIDRHEPMCHIIDKSLAGASSPVEERFLQEHLSTCGACREYLESSQRAIAGLGGFAFEVDPNLQEKVMLALVAQARKGDHPIPVWWGRAAALLLTIAGSLTTWRFASLAAAIFHLQPDQIQLGLAAFWIAPSVCFCLLFLLLPFSAEGWMNKKGSSL